MTHPTPRTSPAADPVVRAAWVGTAVFAVVATAAAVEPDALAAPAAAVDLVLFAAGLAAFGWGFLRAASRSRAEELSVAGIWLLSGSAPAPVRRALLGAVVLETVVAVVSASARPFTPLAFGILVPVFGLGLAGVWGAGWGRFPLRDEPARSSGPRPSGHNAP